MLYIFQNLSFIGIDETDIQIAFDGFYIRLGK